MTDDDPTPETSAIAWRIDPALRRRIGRPALLALERRLRRAARRLGARGEAVEVHVVDDPAIRKLNAAHMGADKPTDVLSFPARPPGEEGDRLAAFGVGLGDVVLSWDAVVRQAAARPGDPAAATLDEATALLVHGLCHLLGHDHAARREGRAMHRDERRALRAARVADMPRPYGLRPTRA
jgi:probable rRNA maturation factor